MRKRGGRFGTYGEQKRRERFKRRKVAKENARTEKMRMRKSQRKKRP